MISAETTEIKCPNCKSDVPLGYSICPYCGYDLRPLIRLKARAELTKQDIFRRVSKLLIRYREFPSDILLAPDNMGPLMIMLVLSLLLALRFLLLLASSSEITGYLRSINIGLLAALLILIFFILSISAWIMITILINLIVKLLGSEPDFSLTLSIVGYSLGPLIVANIIVLPLISSSGGISYTTDLILIYNSPSFFVSRLIMGVAMIISLHLISDGLSKAYTVHRLLIFMILMPLIILLAIII